MSREGRQVTSSPLSSSLLMAFFTNGRAPTLEAGGGGRSPPVRPRAFAWTIPTAYLGESGLTKRWVLSEGRPLSFLP